MPADRMGMEDLYEAVRQQVRRTYAIEKVELPTFQWDIILALCAQELGVRSMIAAGLREEPVERR